MNLIAKDKISLKETSFDLKSKKISIFKNTYKTQKST